MTGGKWRKIYIEESSQGWFQNNVTSVIFYWFLSGQFPHKGLLYKVFLCSFVREYHVRGLLKHRLLFSVPGAGNSLLTKSQKCCWSRDITLNEISLMKYRQRIGEGEKSLRQGREQAFPAAWLSSLPVSAVYLGLTVIFQFLYLFID